MRAAEKAKTKTGMQYRRVERFSVIEIGGKPRLIGKTNDLNSEKNVDVDEVKYFIPVEEMFDILHTIHQNTGHGGRDKMRHEILKKYANITTEIIMIYLSLCKACYLKRSKKRKGLTVKPILHTQFNSRSQVDLIDMQSQPDGDFKFIMVYQDHLTKFVNIRALKSKTAVEVAQNLKEIFALFGAPCILHR